jgi:hypothetical protein
MVLQQPYIIMISKKQHVDFLNWLQNRLAFKHHDNDTNLHNQLDNVIQTLQSDTYELNKKRIMKICKKLYPVFYIEKDENSLFDVGYTKKEKLDILNHVTQIIEEYHRA